MHSIRRPYEREKYNIHQGSTLHTAMIYGTLEGGTLINFTKFDFLCFTFMVIEVKRVFLRLIIMIQISLQTWFFMFLPV